jgi:hypothetical protein
MLDWIDSHGIVLVVGMFIYSNIVASLPRPINGGQFYKFLFTFLNLTAANAPKVFPALRVLGNQTPEPK